MKTYVSVLTYRDPDGLAKVMSSLNEQDVPLDIFVKDNSEDNIYYTAGINLGIKHALKEGADFILLCAGDFRMLGEDTVSKLLSYMSKDHTCGMASPIHLGKSGNVTFAGGEKCFPWGCHVVEPLNSKLYETPYSVPWANTTCVLLRAEAVQDCGLLDENMRFICSDSDYSLTLRARGWTVDIVPDARIEHEYGVSSQLTFDTINKIKHEDCLYFMRKWIIGGVFQELSVEGKTLTSEIITKRLGEITSTLEHHRLLDSQNIGRNNSHSPSINLG